MERTPILSAGNVIAMISAVAAIVSALIAWRALESCRDATVFDAKLSACSEVPVLRPLLQSMVGCIHGARSILCCHGVGRG